MKNPKTKTKVVHSQSKSAWNVIGQTMPGKYKIARLPYVCCDDKVVEEINRLEALEHAQFISHCFNNSEAIVKAYDHG